jgi:hypothetical protein
MAPLRGGGPEAKKGMDAEVWMMIFRRKSGRGFACYILVSLCYLLARHVNWHPLNGVYLEGRNVCSKLPAGRRQVLDLAVPLLLLLLLLLGYTNFSKTQGKKQVTRTYLAVPAAAVAAAGSTAAGERGRAGVGGHKLA